MNARDAFAMIDFLRRWRHYGGGSTEDIFTEFGLPADTFFTRLATILETDPPENVTSSDKVAMLQICRQRLRLLD